MATKSSIKVGDKAPDFSLPSNRGRDVSLSEFKGKKAVVLFFYPKDNTPGCTAEACDFRDSHARFVGSGAEVIGVSEDTVASHEGFARKHDLPMTLLSDIGGKVRALYGVKNTLGFIKGRVTFVIDPQGIVRHVFESQLQFGRHVTEALDMVKAIAAEATAHQTA
jgi:peroxiredoxin Q/BCP